MMVNSITNFSQAKMNESESEQGQNPKGQFSADRDKENYCNNNGKEMENKTKKSPQDERNQREMSNKIRRAARSIREYII